MLVTVATARGGVDAGEEIFVSYTSVELVDREQSFWSSSRIQSQLSPCRYHNPRHGREGTTYPFELAASFKEGISAANWEDSDDNADPDYDPTVC